MYFPITNKAGLRGPAPPGDLHPVPHRRERIERGPDVQDGELVVLVDLAAVVVVDDVPDFRPAAVDDPVVPVERQLIPAMEVCWGALDGGARPAATPTATVPSAQATWC